MLYSNDLIFWIKENRDVIVAVLFNFEANKPMITMRYIKHPTWNYLSQVIISDEVNYIDVLNNMKEVLMSKLTPEKLKDESYVNSVWDIYGLLRNECASCMWAKEDKDEELYCSRKDICEIETSEIGEGYYDDDEDD